jgi:hypothetical protein
MQINTVINVDLCFDCEKLIDALGERYGDDIRPYDISILGDPKKGRIQVRVDPGGSFCELSMDIEKSKLRNTEDLIEAVTARINLMLDEIEQ